MPSRCINRTPLTDQQPIDPERLASLLDGRLNETEAASVREQLSRADEDTLGAYADAVAIAAELGETRPDVTPIESRQTVRRWQIPAFAAAAAAAAIAVFFLRPTSQSDAYPPSHFAAAIPSTATTAIGPVWGVTRGAADGVSDRARAVRVGALLTDIAFDAIRGDTSRAHILALATLLEGSLDKSAAAQYRALAAQTKMASRQRTDQLGRQALLAVDGPLARAGAYLEAARLATAAGDSSYFHRVSLDALTAIESDRRLDATTRTAIARVIKLLRDAPRNAATIGGAVSTLLLDLTT